MDYLRKRAFEVVERARAELGFDASTIDDEIAKVLDPNWQIHLLQAVEGAMQIPGYFSTPRAILEAGCGAGGFLVATLRAGHDSWGIDNDTDRLQLGRERIDAFGENAAWKERLIQGDASNTGLPPNRFDLVLGHQFIEHVDDPGGTVCELLRVAKPGGYVVLFAPDYRAPFEAHYRIPWPPFLSKELCKAWVEGFERPLAGLDYFRYVSAPQIVAIFQSMNCRIINAYNDREIEQNVMKHFDCSTYDATRETAKRMRAAFEAKALPAAFLAATSFGIVAQKL